MPKSVFTGVRIRGVAGAVPRSKVDNLTDHDFCPLEDRKKIIDLTKVASYRKAPPEICSSDLCAAAAESLFSALALPRGDIDAIVFTTMTPDYRVPSTACILQDRLGCSTTTLAYDVNMGCSGFVVGLYNACTLIKGGGLRRVLLLAGDTQTKLCYHEDKNVVFILGDGGTVNLCVNGSAAREEKLRGRENFEEKRMSNRLFLSVTVCALVSACSSPHPVENSSASHGESAQAEQTSTSSDAGNAKDAAADGGVCTCKLKQEYYCGCYEQDGRMCVVKPNDLGTPNPQECSTSAANRAACFDAITNTLSFGVSQALTPWVSVNARYEWHYTTRSNISYVNNILRLSIHAAF